MKRFAELEPRLCEETLRVCGELGFEKATAVQASTIPLLCSNKDVAVEAVTGSGKTLAFVLPVVEILRRVMPPLSKYQVGAVLVAPTRELAAQLAHVASPFFAAALPHLTLQLLTGGSPVAVDRSAVADKGGNILIGTPGRLHDILCAPACPLDLRTLEVAILDEADRLLDMGFQARLSALLELLPRQRRTGLFSATQSQGVLDLARAGLRNPVRVQVRVTATAARRQPRPQPQPPQEGEGEKGEKDKRSIGNEGMEEEVGSDKEGRRTGAPRMQPAVALPNRVAAAHTVRVPAELSLQAVVCEARDKSTQLVDWLLKHAHKKVMLFVMTCACVDYWVAVLRSLPCLSHVSFISLHGQLKQKHRDSHLLRFREQAQGVLVCTDVAARGLDFDDVDNILQFDPPLDPKAFLHRAGRTARMGRSGSASVFLTPQEDAYVEFIRLQGAPLEVLDSEQCKPSIGDIVPQMRGAARGDRDVMEKGLRAFVSFFRGYKEHHCNFIFRWKEVAWGSVATGYGLLQMPSMPDLKRRPKLAVGFESLDKEVDFRRIKFKNKEKEKARQKKLAEGEADERGPGRDEGGNKRNRHGSGEAREGGEKAHDVKGREARQQGLKRTAPGLKHLHSKGGKRATDTGIHKISKSQRKKAQNLDKELENDYRLLKKAKKGKVSEADLDAAFGL